MLHRLILRRLLCIDLKHLRVAGSLIRLESVKHLVAHVQHTWTAKSRGSVHDHHFAAALFAARRTPAPRLLSDGLSAQGSYLLRRICWREAPAAFPAVYQVDLLAPPHQRSKQRWPKALHRWLAHLRQIIEAVNDNLLNIFRLACERPHDLTGFHACLTAKVALHNFCILVNQWVQDRHDQHWFCCFAC